MSAFATGEKAIVYGNDVYPGGNQLNVAIGYVNASGALVWVPEVLFDATGLNTSAAIKAAISAAVVNDAVNNRGYSSFSANDVLFDSVGLSVAEAQGLSGTLTSTIDGKTVGNTTVLTNNSGRDFVVSNVTIVLTSVSGLGTAPVINVGTNSSAYNNIAASFSLTGLGSTVNNTTTVTLSPAVPLVHNGDSIVCRVATAAILTTTYQFKCLVQGMYVN